MWRPNWFIPSFNTYFYKKKNVKLKRRKDKYPRNIFRGQWHKYREQKRVEVIRYWPNSGRLKLSTYWPCEIRFVFEDNGPESRMRNPPVKASPKKRNGLWS